MSEEIVDIGLEKLKYLVILLVSTVLDCVESAFDCMTYRKGKSLLSVLLVVYSFIPITLLASILELGFLNFGDAIVASIFMTIVYSINNITKSQIENSIIFARETAIKVEKKIKEKRR